MASEVKQEIAGDCLRISVEIEIARN